METPKDKAFISIAEFRSQIYLGKIIEINEKKLSKYFDKNEIEECWLIFTNYIIEHRPELFVKEFINKCKYYEKIMEKVNATPNIGEGENLINTIFSKIDRRVVLDFLFNTNFLCSRFELYEGKKSYITRIMSYTKEFYDQDAEFLISMIIEFSDENMIISFLKEYEKGMNFDKSLSTVLNYSVGGIKPIDKIGTFINPIKYRIDNEISPLYWLLVIHRIVERGLVEVLDYILLKKTIKGKLSKIQCFELLERAYISGHDATIKYVSEHLYPFELEVSEKFILIKQLFLYHDKIILEMINDVIFKSILYYRTKIIKLLNGSSSDKIQTFLKTITTEEELTNKKISRCICNGEESYISNERVNEFLHQLSVINDEKHVEIIVKDILSKYPDVIADLCNDDVIYILNYFPNIGNTTMEYLFKNGENIEVNFDLFIQFLDMRFYDILLLVLKSIDDFEEFIEFVPENQKVLTLINFLIIYRVKNRADIIIRIFEHIAENPTSYKIDTIIKRLECSKSKINKGIARDITMT